MCVWQEIWPRWMLEMDGLSCGEKEQIMYKNADLVYTGQ